VASLLAAVLARAQGFLLEPAADPAGSRFEPVGRALVPAEPVRVAVVALGHRSGATTVARGLAAALAQRGTRNVHLISIGDNAAGRELGGEIARWEVPPGLRKPSEVAEYGATVDRLAGESAALVWDIRATEAERASAAITAADRVVAVAAASAEPVLASLVCGMLAERYGPVLLVANRVRDREAWEGRCTAALPESRLGALLAARGRMPGGELGLALGRLAEVVVDGP
jgi:hypothetical protein